MDKLRDDLADVREVAFRDFADFFQSLALGVQAEESQPGFDCLVPIFFRTASISAFWSDVILYFTGIIT
ncbi:hypothetical protein [Pyramidobacter sp. CG50-2]|uniref:hypothetical protein n=1 Tax=Pyramidobacter sp. CG50-2 TaxID=2382160 RepID=UPI000EA2B14D|nr:hypothetical protein [Pyramidobacter sp. CG50-2]RKJ78459.1 hypothetical protein D7D26_06850 [Pyramidobacter sp. CG50-2]